MRKLLLFALAIVCSVAAVNSQNAAQQGKRYNVYGVMFYNLENLFDTINSNGTYDLTWSSHRAVPASGTVTNTTRSCTTWPMPSARWPRRPHPMARP